MEAKDKTETFPVRNAGRKLRKSPDCDRVEMWTINKTVRCIRNEGGNCSQGKK